MMSIISMIKGIFVKNFKNNKLILIALIMIGVSGLYFVVESFIDNYGFINSSGTSDTEISDMKDDSLKENYGEDLEEHNEETSNKKMEKLENEQEIVNADEENVKLEENTEGKIYVYVTGEVKSPGVVILSHGSRISDAIDAAGGITSNANISKVNLVFILQDGMKINVPSSSELQNNPDFEYVTTGSGDGKLDRANISNNDSYNFSHDNNEIAEMVNINTATQTELESLPGIGPSLALKIINFRKENGAFASIEDIKLVNGIGDSKFENIKMFITV